ncbi:MAG: molybdopterin biosynthesis protein [Treponema sp.]|nr:molybdopterin biosynthesis protein [Treponema sp.]MCL2181057.1 molybdopterin biosynthesis protein [Treponema sp.]
MANRNLYLSNIPVEEALSKYLSALDVMPKFEIIPVEDSLDRVTRAAVYARFSSPLFNAAAMDGIAVNAKDTNGARESSPVTLKAGMDFKIVDTGDPVNAPYDAVIMAEDLIQIDGSEDVKIMEAVSSWQHIRPVGEDIVAGEMIIPGRHRIRPIDIGVLFSGGITCVEVFSKPKIAVFPTGTEIIDASSLKEGGHPKAGEIIESNTRMFEALIKQSGGEASRFAPVADNFEKLKDAVQKAAIEYDMVLINAGSSAGTEDFTVQVLREIGEVIVHGVAMKPGKPVILAKVNSKPVIGTPGYPVSAWLSYQTFASPVLSMFTGRREETLKKTEAVISRRIVSSLKHKEYVRITAGKVNGLLVASPLARGAGAAMSLVRADGFCVIDQRSEGIEAGEKAQIELYRSIEEIDRTLIVNGSHDLILDVIADMMSCGNGINLVSCHAGSMAGLLSLKRGECHIAPVHLLDEETGVYNISWIKKILNGMDVCLIKGVGRVQGLIIKKGNPLKIKTLVDLRRCRFINRQRGAGTRLLLDHLLKKEGIDSAEIDGYSREAATHMAAAAAVQSGGADAAMGIASAAKALDLDFIAMGEEEYDFAVRADSLNLKEIEIFIDTLKNRDFHEKLAELGHPLNAYTWNRSGEIVYINM